MVGFPQNSDVEAGMWLLAWLCERGCGFHSGAVGFFWGVSVTFTLASETGMWLLARCCVLGMWLLFWRCDGDVAFSLALCFGVMA